MKKTIAITQRMKPRLAALLAAVFGAGAWAGCLAARLTGTARPGWGALLCWALVVPAALFAAARLFLERRVLAPLSRLADAAGELASGNFDLALPEDSGEIALVNRRFNELAAVIKHQTENLEQTVVKRTRQFAAINDQLFTANQELEARRHEAETALCALRRSEEQLRLLLDSTAEAIYGTDLDGRCTFCNSACLRLLGYSDPAQLVGKDLRWQVHRRLRGDDQISGACHRGERIHLEEEQLWRADGSWFSVEFWSYPQYRDGRIVGQVATFLDISERLQAQEKLLKLSRAVENSPAAVVITDRTGCIEYVNPKFTEIAGYLPEEAIGQNPRILGAGLQSKEFYRELWQTVTSGNEWRGEFCNRRKNGEIHWEHASISPIRDDRGNITHYVAVKEDVTERKRVAEELQQAKDEAEAANGYKSEFLANMSHEIRTPLNAIVGFSQLALEREPDPDGWAAKVHDAARTLIAIVNDILDFSKVEAGRLELEQAEFRLEQAIGSVLAVVEQRAAEKGLNLALELPPELAGRYLGDQLRLGQVLTNLLSNAVKFTGEGEVRLSISQLARGEGRALLRFSVTDTGIGLSAASLAKLFTPFTQGDGSTTRRFGGTGLGLSISKRLVELMGGEIRAESEPGVGSTFSFTASFKLPDPAAAHDPSPAAGRLPQRDLTGVRVLLVEDHEVNRQLATILLSRAGARVETAANGREAVAAVTGGGTPFDLVLMDVQMPEMDGYQATAEIRRDPRFAGLPVIAMTAHAMASERSRLIESGMDDYVIKPIDAAAMFETIARHLPEKRLENAGKAQESTGAPDDEIPFVPGVERTGALYRLDGNRKLFRWLLYAFLETETDTADCLEAALAAGDLSAAERLAHTTKGSAGTIGAVEVMAVAAALEEAICRRVGGEAFSRALCDFRATLERFLADLSRALPQAEAEPLPDYEGELDLPAAQAVLAQLLQQVAESDGAAGDHLDRYRDRLAGVPDEELARLRAHLAEFDYDAAFRSLTALSDKLGAALRKPALSGQGLGPPHLSEIDTPRYPSLIVD